MRALVPLLPLLLLLPGSPALSGCDSQAAGCTSSDDFATEDITPEGTTLGATAEAGSCVTVSYVGRLAATGEVFDEGTDLPPFFVAPGSGVVEGFALGVSGQRVGQTRRVTVPPRLGYGSRERSRNGEVIIPSCSTLEFDITLVRVNQDTRLCTG